jgi:hypothetical protein
VRHFAARGCGSKIGSGRATVGEVGEAPGPKTFSRAT